MIERCRCQSESREVYVVSISCRKCRHFKFIFLGKPVYEKDNPDWAPSQKLGYDYNKVTESSQERYNRAQERVEKRRRSEGAIALMELSKTTMEEIMDTGVAMEELNCKACQTDITDVYLTELRGKRGNAEKGKCCSQRTVETKQSKPGLI